MWSGGIEEWSKAYESCLKIWLEAMEEQEQGVAFFDGLLLSVSPSL
jgi:hypothetical protein